MNLRNTLATSGLLLSMLILSFEANALSPTKAHSDSIPSRVETYRPVPSATNDTIKALKNLFKRKRRFGFVKCIVFGSAVLYSINHTLHPSEANHSKGWQKDLEEDATIFALCAGSMMTVNGTLQIARYSQATLKTIAEERFRGIPFPKELIAKLRPSDFK
jgi:hypothetical protein